MTVPRVELCVATEIDPRLARQERMRKLSRSGDGVGRRSRPRSKNLTKYNSTISACLDRGLASPLTLRANDSADNALDATPLKCQISDAHHCAELDRNRLIHRGLHDLHHLESGAIARLHESL
jgi:hypothetical protein